MKPAHVLAAFGLALALSLPGLRAQGPPQAPSERPPIQIWIEARTFTLPNGMTFILVPREGAPTFAGWIAFKVGGVNSVPGDSGLAHMFEHMAFKGTEHINTKDWAKEKPIFDALKEAGDRLTILKATGKGTPEEIKALEEKVAQLNQEEHRYIVKDEFDTIYSRAGQRAENASTGEDFTQYFVMLPSNALELWMLLESQRIREPVMREFYSERDVIAQERLMRVDNDPTGKLYENFIATAFMAHPYRIPGIGWASDIPALTMEQAERFFHRYYSPSNAVGVLVGNFDPVRAKALIERYFGTIPRRGDPLPIVTKEPVQETQRRVTVPFDANPQLLVGWHKPTWPDPEDTRFDVLSTILSDGVTSRLYKRMVEKEGLALDAQTWNGSPGSLYDNLFVAYVIPNEGVDYARAEKVLFEEIDRLKSEPVSAQELQKAKTRLLASTLRRLDSVLSTAMLIGQQQLLTGDWKNLYRYLDEVQAVTPQDLQKAAATYLTTANRTVAELVKPAKAPSEEGKP